MLPRLPILVQVRVSAPRIENIGTSGWIAGKTLDRMQLDASRAGGAVGLQKGNDTAVTLDERLP